MKEEMVVSPREERGDLHPPSYAELDKCPGIGREKLVHLIEMYDRWIPPERRLEVLSAAAPVQPVPTAHVDLVPDGPISSALAQQHQQALKKKTCSVPGCDGTGHKNVKRWAKGHSTKSGCPIHHGVPPPPELVQ